jgi:hypothetical protein
MRWHADRRLQLCWLVGWRLLRDGYCEVTMDADTKVSATFNLSPPLLPPSASSTAPKCKKGKVKRKGKCVKKKKKHKKKHKKRHKQRH